MSRLLVLLVALFLWSNARGQDRSATVTRTDGKVFAGRVVAMDLGHLQLQVGDEVLTIAAEDIRTCHFDYGSAAAKPAAAATPPPKRDQRPKVALPLPDPVVVGQDEPPPPHDLRRSRFRARLEVLDEAYPWLVPTEPIQWFSIGLLLFTALSLVVHLSARVVGSEIDEVTRCMALSGWYMLTAVLQMAMVPASQLGTFVMLLANPACALFAMRNLFGLSRGAAVIAFAVQLGFLLLGFGVLELVTSLLGSIGTGQV